MRELALAFRALRLTPATSLAVILSLSFGLGASTAVFSIIDSVVMRMLPVRESERLVVMSKGPATTRQMFSYATWEAVRDLRSDFEGAIAWSDLGQVEFVHDDEVELVDGQFVSGDFFATLGVPASVGRTLTPLDDTPGAGPDGVVAIISHRLWQRRFGSSNDVVGRRVMLERTPVTIVGVAPRTFLGLEIGRAFDVLLPIHAMPLILTGQGPSLDRDMEWLRIMLRLNRAQSVESATARLRAAQNAIRAAAMPRKPYESFLVEPFVLEPAATGLSSLRNQFRPTLLILFAIVLVVLLVACSNIANLMFTRGVGRMRDTSVRLSLGATRWQLMKPLLLESIVLGVCSGCIALLFALWASRWLVAGISNTETPVVLNLSLDWTVLAFTSITLLVTLCLFGAIPALWATRVDPVAVLRDQFAVKAVSRRYFSDFIVVAQVAMSVVLIVAALLFVQTFQRLTQVELGFEAERVLVMTVNAGRANIVANARHLFYQQLVDAVSAVPGVQAAGGSFDTPFEGWTGGVFAKSPGSGHLEPQHIELNVISPGWLTTYGVQLRGGRDIVASDSMQTLPIALVNESFVREHLRNPSPIGTVVQIFADQKGTVLIGSRTVVGIINNTVHRAIRDAAPATVYLPLAQMERIHPLLAFYIGARANASPTLVMSGVRSSLTSIDPNLRVSFRHLTDDVRANLTHERLLATLATFSGGICSSASWRRRVRTSRELCCRASSRVRDQNGVWK